MMGAGMAKGTPTLSPDHFSRPGSPLTLAAKSWAAEAAVPRPPSDMDLAVSCHRTCHKRATKPCHYTGRCLPI